MRQFALIVVCMACVAACARQPDVEVIRHAIVDAGAAAAAQRSSDVLAHVSDDFIGNDGELVRTQLASMLRVQMLTKRGIDVRLGHIDVQLDADRATAHFDATLTDASGHWLEDRSSTLHFDTGWRRERSGWRCYNAHWSRVAP